MLDCTQLTLYMLIIIALIDSPVFRLAMSTSHLLSVHSHFLEKINGDVRIIRESLRAEEVANKHEANVKRHRSLLNSVTIRISASPLT